MGNKITYIVRESTELKYVGDLKGLISYLKDNFFIGVEINVSIGRGIEIYPIGYIVSGNKGLSTGFCFSHSGQFIDCTSCYNFPSDCLENSIKEFAIDKFNLNSNYVYGD